MITKRPVHYKALFGPICGAKDIKAVVTMDSTNVTCEECRVRMENLPPKRAKWADSDLDHYKGHSEPTSNFLNTR